jgi:tetratricopeptide (TPR) repeat protein
MNPSLTTPSHAAVSTPRSSWYEPARLALAGFGGLIFAAIFSFLLNEDEALQWVQFLRGQVGFECLGTLWFWKLAAGFALGAPAGYFAFLEIPATHWPKANRIALGISLFWIPVLIYIPAMSAGFLWDDDQEITANSAIQLTYNPSAPAPERFQTNWRGLWEMWTGGITNDKDSPEGRRELGKPAAPWLVNALRPPLRAIERQMFGGDDKANYQFRGNQFADYFPLKTTMLWVEFQLWGYDLGPSGQPISNPHPFHVMNILIHALDGVLLWLLLRQLGVPGAWLGALLFAVHPVHAESVAWIAERKNTLSLFFCLLSTMAWLRFADSKKRSAYLWALGLFVASLLCKTHVVVFPAVLLLLTWWKTGKLTWRDALRSVPFFAVALFLAWVTVWFQNDRAIGGEVIPIGDWHSRLAGAGVVTWSYFSKALVPINLNTIYANTAWLWWPLREPHMWMFLAGALVPTTLLLMLAIQELYPSRNPLVSRTPFFVFAYFVGTLFPVLGFLTMSYMRLTLQADHFQYFSDITIVALEGAIIATLFKNATAAWRPIIATATVAVICIFCAYTWERAGVHQSEFTLWNACLKKNEASWQAHNHMGADLYRQGKYDEAAPHFARAVDLKPENPEVHNNLGLVLWHYGHYPEAIAQYREAVRIKGEVIELRRNLAGALASLGQFADAAEQYRIMLKDAPNDSDMHTTYGLILAKMNHFGEAKAELENAIQLNPGNNAARQYYQSVLKLGK